MRIFYLALILIVILGTLADLVKQKKKITAWIIFVILAIILTLIAGLRNNIGDTSAYIHSFELLVSGREIAGYEKGFIYFFTFLKEISTNPQVMIFIIAAITTMLNCITLKKYSESIMVSLYLYMTSGYYIVTMNGIRQSMVAAIIFVATTFIIKKNFVCYLITILIMSTFHYSALMMLPCYFIARLESWSKKLYIILGLATITLFMYPYVENFIFSLLGKYADYKEFNEGGANLLRIAVSGVPVLLAYLKKNYIKEHWLEGNIFVNMSILNFVIMCFSSYNWIFARFNIYTQLYSFVLLSYLLLKCFEKKERRVLIYSLLILYLIFFWYDSTVILNINYRSNFI